MKNYDFLRVFSADCRRNVGGFGWDYCLSSRWGEGSERRAQENRVFVALMKNSAGDFTSKSCFSVSVAQTDLNRDNTLDYRFVATPRSREVKVSFRFPPEKQIHSTVSSRHTKHLLSHLHGRVTCCRLCLEFVLAFKIPLEKAEGRKIFVKPWNFPLKCLQLSGILSWAFGALEGAEISTL